MTYDNGQGFVRPAPGSPPPPPRPLTEVSVRLYSRGCSQSFLIGQVYEALRREGHETLAGKFFIEVQRGDIAHMYRTMQRYITIE